MLVSSLHRSTKITFISLSWFSELISYNLFLISCWSTFWKQGFLQNMSYSLHSTPASKSNLFPLSLSFLFFSLSLCFPLFTFKTDSTSEIKDLKWFYLKTLVWFKQCNYFFLPLFSLSWCLYVCLIFVKWKYLMRKS